MSRPRRPLDPLGQHDLLLETLRNRKPGWERERLTALKQALAGKDTSEVALGLGRSVTTVKSWIDKFRSGGVDGLLSKDKGTGPPSQLTVEMRDAMAKQLEAGKWRTAGDAWKWLSENFEVSHLKQSVIYKYLGKCGGRLKATRPCNPKKDQAVEKAFRTTLAEKSKHWPSLPPGR